MNAVFRRRVPARLALLALPLALLACGSGQAPSGAGAMSAPQTTIPYQAEVTLAVGDQATVHGARGACGEPAPAWSEIELPPLSHGVFVEGPEGVRRSNSCGGETPARAVIYQAVSRGTDSFTLFGDPIRVTVQ